MAGRAERWAMQLERSGAELGADALVPALVVLAVSLAIIAANVVIIATIMSMSGEWPRPARLGSAGGRGTWRG